MKQNKFEIIVPFQGFYNSIHDSLIDDAIRDITNDDQQESVSERLSDNMWLHGYEYSGIINDYASGYIDAFNSEFSLDIEFIRVISPKYYNYETDRILAYINRADLVKLSKFRKSESFIKLCKDNLTSCDGFISHYDNNPKDWPVRITEWDHNQLSFLLLAYCHQESNQGKDYENNLAMDMYETAMNAVYNNLTEQGNRIVKLASYLRDRQARQAA